MAKLDLLSALDPGILDPSFCKPRQLAVSCRCLQSPEGVILCKMSSGGAQAISRSFIIELIKKVEVSILGRKGVLGTRRANVAYPKGKENIASVLKRYKRQLLKS